MPGLYEEEQGQKYSVPQICKYFLTVKRIDCWQSFLTCFPGICKLVVSDGLVLWGHNILSLFYQFFYVMFGEFRNTSLVAKSK